ncbi:MAG: hypothetical protein A3G83_03305 [Betaproteobacteria bacterium RIFCSPLOWO2_12_FULL_68_20]|nr:MAG: hypothetical protein A3G83_03305 [Betaproteobacteria bacterium RIFCSPLOWO2_12_FULL_68_20]
MNLITDALQATLHIGQTLCLRDALGMEIRVREGSLWLTQERDAQDYVIGTGGSFRIDRQGAVLLTALLSAPKGVRMDFVPCRVPARSFRFAAAY